MKSLIIFVISLSLVAGSAIAQDGDHSPAKNRWNGYVGWGASFFPNNSNQTGGNFGLGADFLIRSGLGVNGEVLIVASRYDAAGMVSMNGVYQFLRSPYRQKGFVPFVTAGVTAASVGEGSGFTGGNIGGGAHWWFRERIGLRMEARDHIFSGNNNWLIVRLGLVFR